MSISFYSTVRRQPWDKVGAQESVEHLLEEKSSHYCKCAQHVKEGHR